jgi:hypothetical protein
MYKPLFLAINDGTMGEWWFGLCILIVLVIILGLFVYYTGYYFKKLIRRIGKAAFRRKTKSVGG